MVISAKKVILVIACLIEVTILQQVVPQKEKDSQNEKPSSSRLVGGTAASVGEFPWQGLLYIRGSAGCGCSLLDTQWAVTAAHCTVGLNSQDVSIRFGFVNANAPESTATTHLVETILNHPAYSSTTFQNDISLMKLSNEVTMSDAITTIALPTQGEDAVVGTNCYISGWGALMENTLNFPAVLQKALVPILDNALCQIWYGEDGVIIYDMQFCAGLQSGGIDTCQGDSGGPLACQNVNGSVLQGITSFGIGCAREERPGVYTRVSDYVTWIETNMNAQPQLRPTSWLAPVIFLPILLHNTFN